MPRGGRRTGKPGTAYGNRTDLNQPIKAAPGQTYGKAGQQEAAQRAVPLPQSPAAQATQLPAPNIPAPGMLTQPTQNPNEPIQAGLTLGPGPGPEALGIPAQGDQVLANLQYAYDKNPDPALATLINEVEMNHARQRLL